MRRFHASDTTWRHDDYWKLNSYYSLSAKKMLKLLKVKKYYAPKGKDKAILQESLQRVDRGLMSYTNLSNPELKALYCQRVNVQPDKTPGSRDWLLDRLVSLDDNPEFHKFTSLPPELRVGIYEYYFASFRYPLNVPSQPPLTRASSLTRAESLRLFYASCEFHFGLQARGPLASRGGCLLEIPDEVLLFASAVGGANLEAIKTIHIDVYGLVDENRPRNTSQATLMALKLNISRMDHAQHARFLRTEARLLKADDTEIRLSRLDAQSVLQSLQPLMGHGFSLRLLYELRLYLERLMLACGYKRSILQ